MIPKRLVSAALIAALLVAVAPIPARAGDEPAATTTSLRASIDRAVAKAAATPERSLSVAPPRHDDASYLRKSGAGGGGGGASKVWMVYTFVALAASLGGGYIMYKQLHKATAAAQAQ